MSGAMKVGVGETVITPKENLLLRGFARSQVATGVHDDLHARSLYIEDAKGFGVILMTLSLVYIDRELLLKIRETISKKIGIPEKRTLITCTHTHAGPWIQKAGEKYRKYVLDQAVASANTAYENRAPGKLGIGTTEVLELGRNRRRLLYGGIHPDPQVGIIKAENTKGKLLGIFFVYGCHPSALDWQNRLYSEDWPYYAIKGIKEKVGKDVCVGYFQSCQGDINVGYSSELSAVGVDMPVRTYWYIEVKGNQMVKAVLDALPGITTSDNQKIAMVTDFFDYPLRESFPVTLEQAEKDAEVANKKLSIMEKKGELQGTRKLDHIRFEHFSANQRLETAKIFYETKDRPSKLNIEQQSIQIGNTVIVSVPGEVFSEIGLQIKKRSPFKNTFVLAISGGYEGYMPTAKEFIEGDYEVDGCKYSPKAEQTCVNCSLDLINRLK
ncbi:MAG: neutral/alkaline non-lysosomal ceramidase N-terminal domain-containing protein [Candidatus Latescibacteria bacterium]|nr:neutral/alkaline non-lysosomal ceramidase N-terminal domain-containing protein [Candidatus Latescibacterota bacterium]